MFGAFTSAEVEDIGAWINSLPIKEADRHLRYWQVVGSPEAKVLNDGVVTYLDVTVDHPAFPPQQRPVTPAERSDSEFKPRSPFEASSVPLNALLQLWFAHPCLLENMVNTPQQTTTRLGSQMVCLLRAELGFPAESSCVAGMDELLRSGESPSLVNFGLAMMRRQQLPEPTCLKDVLETAPTDGCPATTQFVYNMLSWATRPTRNGNFLLGLARAFLDLEAWVAGRSDLLLDTDRQALGRLVEQKKVSFERCLDELRIDKCQYREFIHGYELGRTEIHHALKP